MQLMIQNYVSYISQELFDVSVAARFSAGNGIKDTDEEKHF